MKATKITTELMTDDINKTIDFYTKLLNFKITLFNEEKNIFAILKNKTIELMLYQRSEFSKEIPKFKEQPLGGTMALFIQVEDVETTYNNLKDKVKIIQTLHTTNYGSKEFSFEDNNGYVLVINEQLP